MKKVSFYFQQLKGKVKTKSLMWILVGILPGLSACEKVIDLDLNNSEKKYVVEGIITDLPGGAFVRITQTKNFDEDNNYPGINGAVVTISESGGPVTTLTGNGQGVYLAPLLAGTSGKTYTLSATVAGNTFTATSVMPQRVDVDTLYVTDEFFFSDRRKTANIEFQDPPGRGNNYRFIQYFNERFREDEILVQNDDYTDGRYVDAKLFYFDDDDADILHSGDTLRVQLQSIDLPMYKYWFSLSRSSMGGNQQATPANPVTNMKGGALGYFSAHTISEKSIVVP